VRRLRAKVRRECQWRIVMKSERDVVDDERVSFLRKSLEDFFAILSTMERNAIVEDDPFRFLVRAGGDGSEEHRGWQRNESDQSMIDQRQKR
jgi:hypothetical protein